jgi:hypothetical protein
MSVKKILNDVSTLDGKNYKIVIGVGKGKTTQ